MRKSLMKNEHTRWYRNFESSLLAHNLHSRFKFLGNDHYRIIPYLTFGVGGLYYDNISRQVNAATGDYYIPLEKNEPYTIQHEKHSPCSVYAGIVSLGVGFDVRITDRWSVRYQADCGYTTNDEVDFYKRGKVNDFQLQHSLGVVYSFSFKKSKSKSTVDGELSLSYGKRLNAEVALMMNEWTKMMNGESMEDYQIRVNDSTRVKQKELFHQIVATAMAGDRLSIENPFAGDYLSDEGLLTINFNTLPPIFLPVPVAEVGDFNNPGKLKFANEVYILRDDDIFELVYVEVTNELNDKVYFYDRIGRTKLTAMETDLNFVPLDILQQAMKEEAKLTEMKEEMVAIDTHDKLISENTQISVDTKVIPDVNANGNKILNYQVNYKYEVINKEFSSKEDFPPGAYDITKSNAAMTLMKIIKQSFEEGDFAKYLTEGKRVKVFITGTADVSPINGKIKYDGRYGNYTGESYYYNNELQAMTVTSATGITSNPQLAFIRAASVENYLSKNIATLQNTRNDYIYNVEVSEERGGDYRKILIQFLIVDAF